MQQTAEHLDTQPHLPHTCLASILTASLYSYSLTGVGGSGWAGVAARDQSSSTNFFPETRYRKGKRKDQDTPLKASLGRQLGKQNLTTLSKEPHSSPSWPQKRNSHQSSPESFPLGPQGKTDFLHGPLASSGSSQGLCILLSNPGPSPGVGQANESTAVIGSTSRFLNRKHGFRGQREPGSSAKAAQEPGCLSEDGR